MNNTIKHIILTVDKHYNKKKYIFTDIKRTAEKLQELEKSNMQAIFVKWNTISA